MTFFIAKYINDIIDRPQEKWGTIRDAVNYYINDYSDLIVDEFTSLVEEDELDMLYGEYIEKALGNSEQVELPEKASEIVKLMQEKSDLAEAQATTLIVEIVRAFIRDVE